MAMSVGVVSPVFIGRHEEMTSLASLMRRAGGGEPAFALIGGEAGVGKTRLVRELAGRASGAGFLVLTGQCVELGAEGLPLAPLVDALRTLARTTPPEALADVLGPAGPGLARLLPELAPGTITGPPGDDIQKAQLLELVLGLLGRLSATRPVLFVVEDLHWADQSTPPPSWSGHCAKPGCCSCSPTAATNCTGAIRCDRCSRAGNVSERWTASVSAGSTETRSPLSLRAYSAAIPRRT
jgi:hypothetical protein